jgi:hypothetical protein
MTYQVIFHLKTCFAPIDNFDNSAIIEKHGSACMQVWTSSIMLYQLLTPNFARPVAGFELVCIEDVHSHSQTFAIQLA